MEFASIMETFSGKIWPACPFLLKGFSMKKRIALYLTLCLLLIVSVAVLIPTSAQDNTPTPDPNNACNTGGAMAGKCNSGFHADGKVSPAEIEWAWKCGWYIARYYTGTFTRDQVP